MIRPSSFGPLSGREREGGWRGDRGREGVRGGGEVSIGTQIVSLSV